MTEDKMVGWHHRLNGHEFEQAVGDGEGQGSLACCNPWGCKESDTTALLNNDKYSSDSLRLWSFEVLGHHSLYSFRVYCVSSAVSGDNYLYFYLKNIQMGRGSKNK